MTSEYDPVFGPPSVGASSSSDLAEARELFEEASRPFLGSPLPWLGWAILFPAAALLTGAVAQSFAWVGVLLLWSATILVGGFVEIATIRSRRPAVSSSLASWVFQAQANLSLIAVVLSLALLFYGRPEAIPAVWLLVLGHSLFMLGGLAFGPVRQAGLLYQVGGILTLLPLFDPMVVLAVTTFFANGWIGLKVAQRNRAVH